MLVGVLMKQVAIAIVLSVLLYCYSLIMGTSDLILPWALKILMIALVTVAVFIYRKPFSHLFSAVGYGTIGSTERAEYSLREAGSTFRRSTLDAATVAVPGVAGYRAARWARRNPGQAAAIATGSAAGVAAGAAASADAAAGAAGSAGTGDGYASRLRPDAPPPADGDGDGDAEVSSGPRRVAAGVSGASAAGSARARNVTEADSGTRVAPPLDLPPRPGNGSNGSAGVAGSVSGWSRGAGRSAGMGTGTGAAGPQPRAASPASPASSGPVRSQARSRDRGSAPPITGGGSGQGSGFNSSGPAWPASGWSAAGARSARGRSGAAPRPTPPPAEPAGSGGKPSNGHGPFNGHGPSNGHDQDEPRATPFWLRPIRRDK